jgi:PAS domain S-box-containing protein
MDSKGNGRKKPKKVKCCDIFNCKIISCPAYNSKNLNCWLIQKTHCRSKHQLKHIDKMDACLNCKVFKTNADMTDLRKAINATRKQKNILKSLYKVRDEELESMSMELAISLSETFEALKKISSGDPTVRISEVSDIDLIEKLKHMINLTASEIGSIVDQSHDFAIDLAEYFDVLHKVSKGDLTARVRGGSHGELSEALKNLTNTMINNISKEMNHRRQAEEDLRKEKIFTDSAINSLPGVFYLFDQNGHFLRWNANVEIFTGYSSEEVSQMTPLDFFSEDDRDSAGKAVQEVFTKGDSSVEAHLLSKDGSRTPYFFTGKLFILGNEKYLIGMGIDIAKRKKFEEALTRAEKDWEDIFQAIGHPTIILDTEHNILFANKATLKASGYAEEQLKGRKCYEVFHKSDRPPESCPLVSMIRSGGMKTEEREVEALGGVFLVSCTPMFDEQGNIKKAIHISTDITERKKYERALIDSEQKYRTLFEESKDVVYISTPEGKFIDINRAGVELFGYDSKEELLGIDIAHELYVNPEDRANWQQMLYQQEFIKDYEAVMKRRDGRPLNVLITSTAIRDDKQEIIAYRGIIKDITDWKRLEQQLLQAQKMEAIGQLAGGIAHDFNNILTAIIGYGNLMKMQLAEGTTLSKYSTHILDAAEKAAKLTQDLLSFSRRQMINPQAVDLNEIVRKSEKLLSRLIGEDIELEIIPAEGELIILADSTQIEQILMNLSTNARDAMPHGGKLTIRTELIEFEEEYIKRHGYGKTGTYALLSVEDSGEGIDQKTKERVFEPFFTTKEIGKGTGLGLSMVYGIVKQHNGYINLYSEKGTGSIFKIYLPFICTKVEGPVPIINPAVKHGTETILIAEDDARVRNLIKEVLQGYGYHVLEAKDGEDAIDIFNEFQNEIQLLILDVIMPRKNGKEAYDKIKTVNPDIKVLFSSGYNVDIIHKKGILEEGLDFLVKPISPNNLLRTVREILDR